MSKIQNAAQLATTPLRHDGLAIAEAGLAAIDTEAVVVRSLRVEDGHLCVGDITCSVTEAERIFVVGVGKCSARAAYAVEQILGDKITDGIALDVENPSAFAFKRIRVIQGTHPMPTDQNVDAAKQIVTLLKSATERDVVLMIISGGGSTLLCLPDEDATCVEEDLIVKQLFAAGATIQELNTIRKHMSLARGGFLATYAYPSQVLAMVFSDVPGDDLQFIASGPTVMDTTTIADADRILDRYDILRVCGLEHCGLMETPKDPKYFANVQNVIVCNNETALRAMAAEASRLGYAADVCSSCLTGEAQIVGTSLTATLHRASAKRAYLYGGETTVTIRGRGKGGRNREVVLGALAHIGEDELVISLASDGRDYTDIAGAIADSETAVHAKEQRLDSEEALLDNASEDFFEASGDAIMTGRTGSNVSDLLIALKA
ncbi:hypothetical protein A2765_03370 [Candidatus Kaiserbacteria bacterium RIFCSPHIGHO2_01_FULL_56_24]|uniref:Glycerate kinase n=1 Tax=Candidatus Kaiserbacteria bacterium RIFCSPHIGHO2_01_FULL_56_24 TaxID=1798487 RepID=A0A1F6DD33_9BACT|nr:MAG: hypothetical protein A2765_03370 [Candidatus Kaiserbacteria bacterium RIFCSPHIGHO2_01_FULL_56_24]